MGSIELEHPKPITMGMCDLRGRDGNLSSFVTANLNKSAFDSMWIPCHYDERFIIPYIVNFHSTSIVNVSDKVREMALKPPGYPLPQQILSSAWHPSYRWYTGLSHCRQGFSKQEWLAGINFLTRLLWSFWPLPWRTRNTLFVIIVWVDAGSWNLVYLASIDMLDSSGSWSLAELLASVGINDHYMTFHIESKYSSKRVKEDPGNPPQRLYWKVRTACKRTPLSLKPRACQRWSGQYRYSPNHRFTQIEVYPICLCKPAAMPSGSRLGRFQSLGVQIAPLKQRYLGSPSETMRRYYFSSLTYIKMDCFSRQLPANMLITLIVTRRMLSYSGLSQQQLTAIKT